MHLKKIDSLDIDKQKSYVFHYLKRLTVMYLIWSAVYFIFVIIKWTRRTFSVNDIFEYIKDFFFEGSYSTIWYLPALFGATLIVYLLHKKFSHKTIFAISCFIYVFTLLGSSYYGLAIKFPFLEAIYRAYYSFFDSIKNAVCFGMIFVSMGAIIAENNEKPKTTTPLKAFLPVLSFSLLLAAEEFLVAYFNWNIRGVDTVIFLVPFTYFFFRFVMTVNLSISDGVALYMRKYSILMFLCQRIPLSIIDLFLSDTLLATNSLIHFSVVLVTTLLISFIIDKLSNKFKFIKYAY